MKSLSKTELQKRTIRKAGTLAVSVVTAMSAFNPSIVQATEMGTNQGSSTGTQNKGTGDGQTKQTGQDQGNNGQEGQATGTRTDGSEGATGQEDDSGQKTEYTGAIYNDKTFVHHDGKAIKVKDVAQQLEDSNPLGIASAFHLFGDTVNVKADLNGNVAANHFSDSNDFGTHEKYRKSDHTDEDINFINELDNINPQAFRNESGNVIVFGDKVSYPATNDEKDIMIGKTDHKLNVAQNKRHGDTKDIILDNKSDYINISDELDKLGKKSDGWMKQDDGIKLLTKDSNNIHFDLPLQDKSDKYIFLNINASELESGKVLTINGLNDDNDTIVIINVHSPNSTTINAFTHFSLVYGENDHVDSYGHDHAHKNHILWNFGTKIDTINITNSPFMGSILAPNATVSTSCNIDGNIVAKTINITQGETHRWDLASKIIFPEQGGNGNQNTGSNTNGGNGNDQGSDSNTNGGGSNTSGGNGSDQGNIQGGNGNQNTGSNTNGGKDNGGQSDRSEPSKEQPNKGKDQPTPPSDNTPHSEDTPTPTPSSDDDLPKKSDDTPQVHESNPEGTVNFFPALAKSVDKDQTPSSKPNKKKTTTHKNSTTTFYHADAKKNFKTVTTFTNRNHTNTTGTHTNVVTTSTKTEDHQLARNNNHLPETGNAHSYLAFFGAALVFLSFGLIRPRRKN